ncbi:MAG: YidC/Oxa1 family insertase periplasmic-domain containing protein [Planctomycetia bacterium]|nr:YidC/Oxa1 family insertase periplasmic-domain containing protein [Planctomycetia bacterium]
MEKRLPLFLVVAFGMMLAYTVGINYFFPHKPKQQQLAQQPGAAQQPAKPGDANKPGDAGNKPDGAKPDAAKPAPVVNPDGSVKPADAAKPAAAPEEQAPAGKKTDEPAGKAPLEYVTLGSLNPADPQGGTRMLVTVTNRGAAVVRIELNRDKYRDQEDQGGYLGHFVPADFKGSNGVVGATVQVVGPGTPAAIAGLKAGDVITAIGTKKIEKAQDLSDAAWQQLCQTQHLLPGSKVDISVERAGQPIPKLSATLTRRPLDLIRPEWETAPLEVLTPGLHDPLSLELTLSKIGTEEIESTDDEIPGVAMHDVNWEITDRGFTHVELTRHLPRRQLTVVKRYRLAEVPAASLADAHYKAYHLSVDIEVRRDAGAPIDVAYRFDGPNGLPTEGWWYLSKIGRTWGAAGMRDVAAHFAGQDPELIDCSTIYSKKSVPWPRNPLGYVGVDTPYFSAILIPEKPLEAHWNSRVEPHLVGKIPAPDKTRLANTSCRLTSDVVSITPDKPLKHTYVMFAGPKERDILSQYGPPKALDEINLSELIYYGWPIWALAAKPLSYVLHVFAQLGNYGLAIIMLTVLVRLCMFPLSRKQALNAQTMQAMQPEMKKISERYKKDLQKRGQAIQELQARHGYSAMSGCLPMFIQMPIFIGLYRALMVNIELRQAPLFTETFGWCNNLAAPDMLWRWEPYLPSFLLHYLGPYLNILPLITVGLFILQQQMFMPPATDEQTAMQQKMMKYMMIFMGFMFFKVPSGLCLYFIASSLWGIGERKLLPKPTAAGSDSAGSTKIDPPPSSNGNAENARRRRKERGKK